MKIGAEVLAAIEAHARQAAPEECCGLLLGSPDAVTQAVMTRNASADRERCYEIDPNEHFRVLREARVRGLDVVGAYHSHPRTGPLPSETDRQQAFENFAFLIISLAGPAAEIRAWRLSGGNFIPLPIVRLP